MKYINFHFQVYVWCTIICLLCTIGWMITDDINYLYGTVISAGIVALFIIIQVIIIEAILRKL